VLSAVNRQLKRAEAMREQDKHPQSSILIAATMKSRVEIRGFFVVVLQRGEFFAEMWLYSIEIHSPRKCHYVHLQPENRRVWALPLAQYY
jgi:hypothetical protein